jgi:hypothetical protein
MWGSECIDPRFLDLDTSLNTHSNFLIYEGHDPEMGGKTSGISNSDSNTYVGGWIIFGWIFLSLDGVMWTGLVWLRIGIGGELLCIRY